MIKFLLGILVMFLSSLITAPAFAQVSAEDIISKVDAVRNPQLDYTGSVVVTSLKPNTEPRMATYEIMVKGRDRTVVKTILPKIEQGRILLMREKNLWAFFPDVTKPLRISLQERLIGEVANGDIARANFSGDYNARIMKTENIGAKEYYVLELSAVSEEVTYAKVILWAQKETFWPLKAEFYALSGRLLKICSYENYKMLTGRLRPSRLVMEDPLVKGQKSIIEYDNMQIKELPETYFTKDYMKKFIY